ncbi:hypothetical protein CLF_104127 [Clonorchis sinensis]|uniref:Uncharacterized protein n=1 Tax=Clonorchis sinensis TaxID=79923 RepID=G7YB16_CLOSI|nr:hypothetical protein CLF_104127 [Clonorchis sinensis]
MNLCVVTIFGGLLFSQVLGNPQLNLFEKDQTDLHSNKIIHISKKSPSNKETDPTKSEDDNFKQGDQPTPKHPGAAEKLSAKFSANSVEQNKSTTQNITEADLQNPGMQNSRGIIGRRWKPKFEVLGKPTEPEFPSNHPDVEQPAECPCTYDKLKVMRRTLRNAEYVLEDVMLHLKRTRKLEKIVSDLLNSMDRTLRGNTWPICYFEVLGKPTEPEFPSNHPDVEQPAECPCTYDKLKVMRRTLRNAEYVLEDVMLHLKRTRKLEKIVSDLLNSMDRTLRGNTWPM